MEHREQARVRALWRHLRESRDEVAFELDGRAMTFGELDVRARSYAAGLLALGVARGDRVASVLDTSLEMIVALIGHYYAGVIHVPVNTRYGRVEIAHVLSDSGAVAVLVDAGSRSAEIVRDVIHEDTHDGVSFGGAECVKHVIEVGGEVWQRVSHAPPLSEALPGVRDEDVAMFIYTSGTTGPSKGVMLSFRAVVANIDALTTLWRVVPDDVMVLALPLFHVHGLCIGVHGVLLRGCRAQLHVRFDAGVVCEAMGRGGTVFMGVPTMYARLLRAMDDTPERADMLRGARLFTSGSAALPADRFNTFERLTGHRILERYGMSETLLTVSNPYPPHERIPGTIGCAVPSGEVRVVRPDGAEVEAGEELGEIIVRGDSLMHGYWNLPQKTAETLRDGWLWTGDVATVDASGRITHRGRRSVDILKCGGYKISAREIEEVLARHPALEEVAVVGVEDAEWGQRVEAFVALIPSADAEADWTTQLVNHARGELASYKLPSAVHVVEALPRNALGKVQKHLL